MGVIIRAALRVAPEQILAIAPVRRRAARDLVARVYTQVERDFGVLAPPVRLHSPAPGPLAAAWVILRETLIAAGRLDRVVKEAVAAAVSLGNACPYCVEVHSATLHGLAGGDDARAIAGDRLDAIVDPRVRELAEWARVSGTKDLVDRHPVPARIDQLPELIGVAVTFQYYNRMVNVFLVDSPFPPGVPPNAVDKVRRVFGRLMRPAAIKVIEPGASLSLLPGAPLPDDLAWTRGNPIIADAFARAAAAVDEAGARAVPEPVRRLVLARLARWSGEPTGLSRAWVDEAVAGLDQEHRPAGRLALLTAFASYQVDRATVEEARLHRSDEELVGLVSWAALAASRRVGTWVWAATAGRLRRLEEPPAA